MDASTFSRARPGRAESPTGTRIRALLVLGRVSNLPTVWSNCLAAWLLAGGGPWSRFALVNLGATLLYIGGMFLNDAADQSFDRCYRPERPIPSGRISSRTVWILSAIWLVTGWALFLALGKSAALLSSILLGAIVVYDFVHKRTLLAPVIMALCRFLLYLAAASVIGDPGNRVVLWRAFAIAAYIVGLSYLARGESKPEIWVGWTVVLLFAPVCIALLQGGPTIVPVLVFAAVQVAWTLWCLLGRASLVASGVAGLLSGIVLVDGLAAAGHGFALAFLALFILSLCLQRLAPAT